MKRLLAVLSALILLSVSCTRNPVAGWKIAENPIVTRWAEDVNPASPWLTYPRPDMARDSWISLNGLWDYAISGSDTNPATWDGSILVPYPVESALSGVRKRVSEKEYLWYHTTFEIPNRWSSKNILLNFEACDWEATVWVDGKEAGKHRGGYDPFSFDITELLTDQKSHELLVRVWDPTDRGYQPRGKQVSVPEGIWYTPSTGIWQTVWIEPVNDSYISSFRTVTDADNGTITITADVINPENKTISVEVSREGKKIAEANGPATSKISLKIDNPVLWSPENPALYDVEMELFDGNRKIDKVESYTGIRKISLGKTPDGFTRILLNNEFVYQNGPLDQGFWPDGIYTPPTEEAMVYDLKMTKAMGFNMLRKHVKAENRIFYYWCDKLGILVWQDMPSGDLDVRCDGTGTQKSREAVDQFEYEWKRIIETRYNHPSIIIWVPFNEGWGQFDTERITALTAAYDPTRLVNSASGWCDLRTGDMNDLHHYPEPVVPPAEEKRAVVLGEFGGLGLALDGHTWEKKNWGYRNMEDTLDLLSRYESFYDMVYAFVRDSGLSASVYTQTTDVETETNGLMTYNREINKMGVRNVYNANNNIIPPALVSGDTATAEPYLATLKSSRPGGTIFYIPAPGADPVKYTAPFRLDPPASFSAYAEWPDGRSRTAEYIIKRK